MNRFSLFGIVIAALLASPAFAEDLCTTNLQKLCGQLGGAHDPGLSRQGTSRRAQESRRRGTTRR